jgi:hypothetical protein
MNQWLFDTLEAFIATLVKNRDTLLLRKPAQAVPLPISVTPMPETPAAVASGGGHPLLDRFCTLIRNYEGIPGDPNYINNNPGDVRYNEDGYLAKYEPVTKSPGGFAVFPSYEIGWMYLENMITGKIHAHPNWTLLQFFQGVETSPGLFEGGYAPASDGNDPILYSQTIGKGLSVDYTTYKIKNILA